MVHAMPWWWWLIVLPIICAVLAATLWWRGAYAKLLSRSDMRTFQPTPHMWPLAASSWYAVPWGTPWDTLEISADGARQGLVQFWSVTNRVELLDALYWLLTDGHRTTFDAEVAHWSRLDDAAAEEVRAGIRAHMPPDEAVEALWRLDRIRANDRDIAHIDFAAWDFVRFLLLCRLGFGAGFINADEAYDFMTVSQLYLQPRFPDWSTMLHHYAIGRWFWNSEGGLSEMRNRRDTRVHLRKITSGDTAPTKVTPYGMPPPPCRWLFVDALAAAGLPPLTDEERATATDPARHIDDILTGRRPR